jgi:hypothetical protein
MNIGSLELALFNPTQAFSDPLALNSDSDDAGIETIAVPGGAAGLIHQGWIEQRPAFAPELASRLLLAIIAASALFYCTRRESQAHPVSIDTRG